MSEDSDLVKRFVGAALKGELHLPEVSQLFAEAPETPELVQPLKDFYAAIATFISKVNCNSASVPPEESTSQIVADADDDQTETQPLPESTGDSAPFHYAHVEVYFRKDDEVITLLPKNKQQCQDLPFLMSQASALGASDAGVFKYLLSDDFDIDVSGGQAATSSSFSSSYDNTVGGFRVTYHQTNESITVRPTTNDETPAEMLATQLEDILRDPSRLSQMRYCTDYMALTEEQRRACGCHCTLPSIHCLITN